MDDLTVNRFRSARGKILHKKIMDLRAELGRDITVLDVGGRPDYWQNVGTEGCGKIILVNYLAEELERMEVDESLFEKEVGDATDLKGHGDQHYDLIHSNSVIEHVGNWDKMAAMASEVMRVGRAGWVQTPAFEFPIEPHFRLPCAHWLPAPLRRAYIKLYPYGKNSLSERRSMVDWINILSYAEVKALFPGRDIYIERLAFLPKSYTVRW